MTSQAHLIDKDTELPELIFKAAPKLLDVPGSDPKRTVRGVAIIEAIVDETGNIRDPRFRNPEIFRPAWPEFGQAYCDALKKWRFKPARRQGKPIAVYYTVVVHFQLAE